MRNILAITILLLMVMAVDATDGYSQDLHRSGSTYAYFGLGLPEDYRAPNAGAMNIMGTSLFDTRINTTENPAILGMNRYANIHGGFNITGYNVSDEVGSSSSTHIHPNQLHMAFPVLRDRLGVSVSLVPQTQYNFEVTQTGVLDAGQTHLGESVPFESDIVGTGGLNRFEIGTGYRLSRNFYVGVSPAYYFGTLEQSVDLAIQDDMFNPVNYNISTSYSGFGGKAGLLYMLPGLGIPNDVLAIGASVSMPVSLDAERKMETEDGGERRILRETDYYGDRTVEYPLEMSMGATYIYSDNLRFSSDVLFQNWSGFEPYNVRANENYTDRIRAGAGVEFTGFDPNEAGGFIQDLIYRAGVSYDTGNMAINGHDISTMRASLGIGIPTQQRTSSFNLHLDYGIRGTEDNGLIREEIFEIRMSFNLSELMFFRPRLR